MSKRKKDEFVDDGRIIANMDIEGMPWNNGYNRFLGALSPKNLKKLKKKQEAAKQSNPEKAESQDMFIREDEWTKQESRTVMLNAILGVLLIGGVFLLAAFLFLLFCTNIWFA